MPKKPPRNSFYFYMIDFKAEQLKKGINYKNMAEVAEAAGPLWRDAHPSIRSKYDNKAKMEKQRTNVPEMKFTSTGISFAEIEHEKKEREKAEDIELKDIKNFVNLKSFDKSILTEDIFIMDCNFYCQVGTEYVIAESTVLRFSLQKGIDEIYHEIVNPGSIPTGYASDMKLACAELGLEMPDDIPHKSHYIKILACLVDHLKKKNNQVKNLPMIFTMPDKVAPVLNFIQQMCGKAAEDDTLFRVYKLDTLFYYLINGIASRKDEGFPKQSLALMQLKKDPFKYTPGLGCTRHEEIDKSVECTMSRVKRWAFTILDSCCPIVGIEIQPGRHVPGDYDVEGICTYKEQKRERSCPTVAKMLSGSSCSESFDTTKNSSVVSSSITEEVVGDVSSFIIEILDNNSVAPQKTKRTHQPLRMPKTDYSATIRAPPELSENNFPSLSSTGLGRGRGIAGSLNRLKLNK